MVWYKVKSPGFKSHGAWCPLASGHVLLLEHCGGTDMFLHLSDGSFWNINQHMVLGALKLIIEAVG